MQRIYHDIRPEDLMRILKRAPLLCVALCLHVVRVLRFLKWNADFLMFLWLPARAIGSWAYLWESGGAGCDFGQFLWRS